MTASGDDGGGEIRGLVRGCPVAALATALGPHGGGKSGPKGGPKGGPQGEGEDDGRPYASLVTVACDHDGAPLLLLSGLAQHTRNIARDQRVALLFGAPPFAPAAADAPEDPLAAPRVTVLGRALESAAPRHRARFLSRHPAAEMYAGFGDFRILRVAVERVDLVAGFGRVRRIDGRAFLFRRNAAALAAGEADILAHMNADHAETLALFAERLAGVPVAEGDAAPWRMTGIDPEGCDLRRGAEVARINFAAPVLGAKAARAELVRLARLARAGAGRPRSH